MSDLVPTSEIEGIVGTRRDQSRHLARAVSTEQRVYILHSRNCLGSEVDLRRCAFSRALDRGIRRSDWDGLEDQAVVVRIVDGRLWPSSYDTALRAGS